MFNLRTRPALRLCGAIAALLAACGPDAEDPPRAAQERPAPPASVPAPAAEPSGPVAEGAALYEKYCALCHGPEARGYAADNAPSLVSPTFAASATDDFLRTSIMLGRPGTAMAGYGRSVGGPLALAQVDAVVAFLRARAPVPSVTLPPARAGNPVHGQAIYDRDCASCHGTQTQRATAVHLANPQFLAQASSAFLRYAVSAGRPGTPMEAWEGRLSPTDMDDVVAYVRTLAQPPAQSPPPGPPPIPPWGPVVINPKGKAPRFKLRDGRYAPIDQVKKALDEKRRIVIVDARPPSDWLKLHITGALPLPHYDLSLLDRLPKDDTWVIAYCGCPHHASGVVVDELRRRGHANAAVLDEGVFAWQQRGYPVVVADGFEKAAAPPPP